MKKFVYSAAALTLVSVPSFASDNGWASLDKEIESLSATLTTQEAARGPKIGGFIRTSYRMSDDIDIHVDTDGDGVVDPGEANNEQGGFQFENVRVELEGEVSNGFSYKVSFDGAGGTADLKDAYANWKFADNFVLRLGQFKSPFLRSSLISDDKLLFIDRTVLGERFSGRDIGLMVTGQFEVLRVHAAAQNGSDDQGDEWLFTVKAEADVIGNGAGKVEGAYGSGEEANLSAGIAWQDDGEVDDSSRIAVEAALTVAAFSVAAELVDLDDGIGDATPWDVTGSFLLADQWEIGVRYEDFDDTDDTTRWGAAVNYYVSGHDLKWTAQYLSQDSDLAALEIDQLGVGLTLSF